MELKILNREIDVDIEDANAKFAEMIQMQRALDDDIYTKKNVEFNMAKCYMALIDEMGEFTHELKNGWKSLDGEIHEPWCWWKDHLKEPVRAKMVEEYIDMWHFAMSIYYHFMDAVEQDEENKEAILSFTDLNEPINGKILEANSRYEADDLLSFLISKIQVASILNILLLIGLNYEIYPDEIYKVYKEKNAVNYQRLKEGY